MEVYDQNWELLPKYDLKRGYLKEKTRTIHHDAVEGVEEQGHYVTLREYPETGGADVEWVVDVPGVEAREAWDEEVTVNVYIPYTGEELAAKAVEEKRQAAQERITELKGLLRDTDYTVIKIAEGAATREEYGDIIAQRQAWRGEINELEGDDI